MKTLTSVLATLAVAAQLHGGTFIATLTGTQEVPPNSSPGGGGAILEVDLLSGAWTLTGVISNLVASATAAHIHGPAPVGVNAGVLFPISFNVEPEGPLSGSGILTAEQLGWLDSELLYVNVHTSEYPGGEIRGQLLPQPTSVPDGGATGAYALIAGLGLSVIARHRSKC